MKIRFLGACQEIGRSGVAVKVNGKNILVDYGVLVGREKGDIGFPMHFAQRDVAAIFLSHAHLDHGGSIPLFYVHGKVPLYGVEPTFAYSDILIRDFLKLSGYYLPFEYLDLQAMLNQCIALDYHAQLEIEGAKVTVLNAGHIPGSAQVLIEKDGRKVLYTGDINTVRTQLVDAVEKPPSDVDAVIIESTYANDDHSERQRLEEEFVARCTQVVERGGTALVPAFGVGRSQEIIMVLKAHHFQYPIFSDGMAIDAMQVMSRHTKGLRDPDLFLRAIKEVEWVEKWQDRRRATKSPGVIVSPAGMLSGGSALFYLENIASRKENAIFLVTYQVPGTPGRILLERRKVMIHGKTRRVEAEVDKFDFSSHAGRNGLHDFLSGLNKSAKVFTVHGAEGNCGQLAGWASKELGLQATAPKAGEEFEV